MSLRVLVQPRPNFFQVEGGDNIQLEKTIEHLRARDVLAEISVGSDVDLTPYDLVEIYNFGDGTGELPYLFNARRQNKPVVVMPIYWQRDRFRSAYAALAREWVEPDESPELRELVAQQVQLRQTGERLVRTLLLEQSDLILPNSQVEGAQLVRDLQAPPDRMRVIYNGAESLFRDADAQDFVAQYGIRDFILCVARISPQKNQLSLVQAWRDECVPLVLIGNDQEEPRYTKMVQQAAGPNTLFIPHSPHQLIASAYAAARVHALVSWYEMMPLAALEAGSAGCNLVLTTETAGPEFFGDRVWYCEPDDIGGIRHSIQAAYASPGRPELADHIQKEFTWEHTAARLTDAYAEAIDLHQRHPKPHSSDAHTDLLQDIALTLDALARANERLSQHTWDHSMELTEHVLRMERLLLIDRLREVKKRLKSFS